MDFNRYKEIMYYSMTQAESYYRQAKAFNQYLNSYLISSYYLLLFSYFCLIKVSSYFIESTNSYLILIVTIPFSLALLVIYSLFQSEPIKNLISFVDKGNKEEYKKIITLDSLYSIVVKKTWMQSWSIVYNHKANFAIWSGIAIIMAYSFRNLDLWPIKVIENLLKIGFFVHFLWEIIKIIEPRDSSYWRGCEFLKIPRLGYFLISGKNSSWYDLFLAKIYSYDVSEEKEKAAITLVKEQKVDQLAHSFVLYSLIAKQDNDKISEYLKSSYQNYSHWEYFFIIEKIIFHNLNLRKVNSTLAPLFAKNIISFGDDFFNAWDFALVSNNVKAIRSLSYPGVEQQLIQGKYPLIQFRNELNLETKNYLSIKYQNKNWDILKFLGGWQSHYLIFGKISLPQKLFKYKDVSDFGFSNQRLEKLIKEKSFLNIESVELLGGENNKIKINSKVVNTPMLMICSKLAKMKLDSNLIANFVEDANFGAANLFNSSRIWKPVTYPMLRQEAQGVVSVEGVFYTLTSELVARYGEKKTLKIIKNSLSLSENVWIACLEAMLRIKSTPELFISYDFPDKVKDLEVLKEKLEWIIHNTQNPNINLKQEAIMKINQKELGYYKIIVPERNQELIEAGRRLKICVSNGFFLDQIVNKKSYIAFIKLDNKLSGIVEIRPDGKIIQAKTELNANLNPYLLNEFKRVVDENI